MKLGRKALRVLVVMILCTMPGVSRGLEPGQGYDENTEVTIEGAVKEVTREARGPVILKILHRGRLYSVVTAPPWFLMQEGLSLEPGLLVEVTGSRVLSNEGTLYLISRTLRNLKTGRVVHFRDDFLRPIWRGKRHNQDRLREAPP